MKKGKMKSLLRRYKTELLSIIYPGLAKAGCEEQTFQLMLSLHHGSKVLALECNFPLQIEVSHNSYSNYSTILRDGYNMSGQSV